MHRGVVIAGVFVLLVGLIGISVVLQIQMKEGEVAEFTGKEIELPSWVERTILWGKLLPFAVTATGVALVAVGVSMGDTLNRDEVRKLRKQWGSCPECGTKLEPRAEFCVECGASVAEGENDG